MKDLRAWWSSAEWRAAVEPWISRALAEAGIRRTGAIEQPRVRIWSTQLTIATSAGRVWFKENNPMQSFEARLIARLAELIPDRVVQPLAVEPRRGWMLSIDQGPTLYETPGTDERHWARLLSEYGAMQREIAAHSDEVLATGLPSLPPQEAIVYVESQLRDVEFADALGEEARRALPRLRSAADRLSAGPIPLSLDHNDLHSNNAFVARSLDDPTPLRFFDFADAVFAHPFTSLHVPINVMAQEWETDRTDRRISYVVDAYLEGWNDLASPAELRGLLDDALAFGPANRFYTWRQVLQYADDQALDEFGDAPRYWLAELFSR